VRTRGRFDHTDSVPHLSFAAIPAYGHLYPLMPLALACARAGADVTVATGQPFLGRLPLPTVDGIEPGVDLDQVIGAVWRDFPEAREDMATRFLPAFFGDVNPRITIPALRRSWSERPPDLVVHEVLDTGAAVVAAELGVPAVAFGIVQWFPSFAGLPAAAAAALTRTPQTPTPWDLVADALENPPPVTLVDPFPPRLRYDGTPRPADTLPIRPDGWFENDAAEPVEVGERPLVYLTLGTVSFGAVDVIRQALSEAAALDVDVLVAAGPDADLALLGDVPVNVTVRKYVAQAAILGQVDVIVHHGGAGTALSAAAHGVPQVVVPQGADHTFNGGSLVSAGVARMLDGDVVPGSIGTAVAELLGDSPERNRARALAAEIAAMPSPDDVAAELIVRAGG